MGRKIRIAALVTAGLVVVALGAQKLVDRHHARQTIHDFLEAVITGDRDRALALLHPTHPAIAQRELSTADVTMKWEPDPQISYRIHKLALYGDRAVAEVWIEKQGVALKPIFHLRKTDTGVWKVERIRNLHVDPVWQDVQVELLAEEIADAMKRRPGVSVNVSRVPVIEESK